MCISEWIDSVGAARFLLLTGNGAQLQEVLRILMINGIDAMKDADGSRKQINKSESSGEHQLMVSVSDSSMGLPPYQPGPIFNGFVATKPQATEMRLQIRRTLVESHGGQVWATGNSPRGANLHLRLPTNVEARE